MSPRRSPSDYWPNIRALKWHGFLTGLRFYLPVIFVHLSQSGLSFSQIGWLFAAQSVAKLVVTVPCGVISDRWGRKYCVAGSSFVFAIAFTLYGIGDTFLVFLAAAVLQGVAQSLLSGSEEALTYDSLDAMGESRAFSTHFGHKYALYGYAMALSALLASVIVALDLRWTFYLTAACLFASGVLVLRIREPGCTHFTSASGEPWSAHLITAVAELRGQPRACWLGLYIVVVMVSFQIFIQYLQPLLLGTGFEVERLGLAYAGFTMLSAWGAASAGQVDRRMNFAWVLGSVYVALALGFFGLAYSPSWLTILLSAALVQFVNGLMMPVLNAYFHQQLRPRHRATIHAFRQLVLCGFLVVSFPLFGNLADSLGYEAVPWGLGILVMIGAGCAFIGLSLGQGARAGFAAQ